MESEGFTEDSPYSFYRLEERKGLIGSLRSSYKLFFSIIRYLNINNISAKRELFPDEYTDKLLRDDSVLSNSKL